MWLYNIHIVLEIEYPKLPEHLNQITKSIKGRNLYLGSYGVVKPNCVMAMNNVVKYEVNWMNAIDQT